MNMGLEDTFPVPEHLLPRLHVPQTRMEEWKEVAQDEIMRALSHRHSWYNSFKERVRDGFELIADKPQLKAFIRAVPHSNDKDILIRSTLEGISLDDLVTGIYCDTTYDVRCAFAHLYEGNFLDGAILQTHETRTDEDPMHFVGVRWIAFRTPAKALMTSRDFLFFSYEGTAYDVDGNRVLFRFQRSMPMDDIQVDKTGLPPLVTGKISNLHFYRQNGSRVDAFTKAMHSNAGNMPAWVVTKTISFMFPGIANVETICDARALLTTGTAKLNPTRLKTPSPALQSQAAANLAVLASVNACGVCFHKFKLTRAKRRCQGCAREVCKRCTKRMFFFDELKQISDIGVVPLRFCLNCTRQARADVRDFNAQRERASLSTRRSSSASSGSRHGRLPHHRRVPSGNRIQYQPESLYNNSHVSSSPGEDDDSDEESVSYNTYNGQLTTPTSHLSTCATRTPTPLQPHQLQQLQMLQQEQQYDPQDHEEFLRLYNEYAIRHRKQQQRGKLMSVDQVARGQYGPMPSPQPNHRSLSTGNNSMVWNHSGPVDAMRSGGHHTSSPMHTMPDLLPRHMIPPMPQPDGPSRSDMIPLATGTRANSAPNLRVYGEIGPSRQSPSRATLPAPPPPTTPTPESKTASEDLETIFRLRMLLFSGTENDTETSTASSSSSFRKPLVDGELVRQPPPLMQRY